MTPISSNTGKIIPAKIPIFRLSPKAPDTIPTNVGHSAGNQINSGVENNEILK